MVMVSTNATMTCTAKANPPVMSFEWYKDNKIISRNQNHTIINVGPSDSGVYSCVAHNDIKPSTNQPKQSGRLVLSVQYGPIVNLIPSIVTNTGESVRLVCNVTAEPESYSIVWSKLDDSNNQHQLTTGKVLQLNDVSPFDAGHYQCLAKNKIKPSGSEYEVEKSDKGVVIVQVKHAPGTAIIFPADPVAVAGRPFTLSCSGKPPGYPAPKYRWWKEGYEGQDVGQNLTFLSVYATHEGRYFCQPYNAIGQGTQASVYLTVREPPSMIIKMLPNYRKKQGDKSFNLTCKARGKPRPTVSWLHNGMEIDPENGLYRIDNREDKEGQESRILVSTLYFESSSRDELTAADRGKYECIFDNGAGYPVKSETDLKVEHTLILQPNFYKIAYDVGETASLICKVSAYPEPRFEWFYSNKPLNLESRYSQNITEQPSDLWIGSLIIRDLRQSDYGDYTCRTWNSPGEGDKKTTIRLVTKSAPDTPKRLEAIEVLSDAVTLRWADSFTGGFSDAEFIVSISGDGGQNWRNESCHLINPCKITGLESRREYRFKLMAINPLGQSLFSEEVRTITKVNPVDIPVAYEGYYDPIDNLLAFRVNQSNFRMSLIARIEHLDPNNNWKLITKTPVRSELETIRLSPPPDNVGYGDIRVILCLASHDPWCGYPSFSWSGRNGEAINFCDPNPCENGATCHQEHMNYTCECPYGYEGKLRDNNCL